MAPIFAAYMPRLLPFIMLLLFAVPLRAQRTDDALTKRLAAAATESERLPVLLALTKREATNQPKKAVAYARAALPLASAANDTNSLATAWMYMGLAKRNRTEYDSALYCYGNAAKLFGLINDAAGLAQVLIYKGIVLKNSSQLEEALQSYQEAIFLAERAHDTVLLASATLKIAAIHRLHGNEELRLQYIQQAQKLAYGRDSLIYAKSVFDQAAYVMENQNDFDSTLALMEQVLEITNPKQNRVFYLTTLKTIAGINDMLGNTERSELLYQKTLRQLDSLGIEFMKLDLLANLCNLYTKNGRPHKSIALLQNEVIPLAKQHNSLIWLSFAYGHYSLALETQGDYLEALKYAHKYKATNDSLVNQQRVEAVTELEELYQEEKRNRTITKQEADLLRADLENKRKTQQLYATIAIGALLVLLAIMLVAFYRKQQQTTATLAKQQRQINEQRINQLLKAKELESINAMIKGEETERTRIARDVHDRLGSMLSTVKLLYSGMDLHKEPLAQQKHDQFDKATSLLDDACQEVRNIAHNMATGILGRFGLEAALRDLGEVLIVSGQLDVKVLIFDLDDHMGKTIEITAYRIVQEMMNNVLKHAQATEVIIQLNRHEDSLSILVEDNGVGFDPTAVNLDSGMGLGNIKLRVEQLNGTFEIDSQVDVGTSFTVDLPLTTATTAAQHEG